MTTETGTSETPRCGALLRYTFVPGRPSVTYCCEKPRGHEGSHFAKPIAWATTLEVPTDG